MEPARRAGELETALRDALAREDFTAAQAFKDQLPEARQESAIASAAVSGLQTAIAEIDRQTAEDDRAIQEREQRAGARARHTAAMQLEAEKLEELDAAIASVFTGLEAVKRSYQLALQLETEVGQVRAEQNQARVILGEIPAGMRPVAPDRASALAGQYAIVRDLAQWTGPERRTPAPVFVATAMPGQPGIARQA